MSYIEYTSNNSGGSWWLNDADWAALEAAGWVVHWARVRHVMVGKDYKRTPSGMPMMEPGVGEWSRPDRDGRWFGALAKEAYREGLGLREAAAEWERLTGKSATDAGCPCCGPPHSFTEYDDQGKYVRSGPETHYEARWE